MRNFNPPKSGEGVVYRGVTYRFGEEIGRGSFGIVYYCSDDWGNQLAAKVLIPNLKPHDQLRHDWEREVDNLRTFRSPFITFVYDAFEYRDTFYIITEYCLFNLHSLLAGKNSQGWHFWIKPIARSLLQAVQYIHSEGYVHKDIHAGNVLCGFTMDELWPQKHIAMKFKLADLGISKILGDINFFNTALKKSLFPPELLNSSIFGTIDHRIDIYQCGLLFLELLYGREIPFTQEEIVNGKPQQMAEELPPPYNSALSKALERHVNKRTSSAMEFWRNLTAETS